MRTSTFRFVVFAGALTLVAAACGSSNKSSNASSTPPSSGAAGATPTTMMSLPSFAMAMKTSFAAPADNTMVTTNTLAVRVAASGYQLSCDWAGRAPKAGVGHYHLLLDKSLINMFCTPNASVSLQNVKAGKHQLEVVPALNDHAEVMDNAHVLNFDYEPRSPQSDITDATPSGAPSIHIVSPEPGTTVTGNFDVVVDIKNFTPSCNLYGRPDIIGYGHWHLNFDSATGGMGGMATMAGMSCTTVVHTSTIGLGSGPHKLIAILVGDGHAPLSPMISDSVSVTVG